MKQKITVIHHSADYDGLFCREIARKFLPNAELIGWDFADAPLSIPLEGLIYIMDLPVDRVFGLKANPGGIQFEDGLYWNTVNERVIWIDHHKSSIDSHPTDIPGYRIDGVAACRLAWQWFIHAQKPLATHFTHPVYERPGKQSYIDRTVEEPLAVRLAGEYDIWDKRDSNAEVFQFGLRSKELTSENWHWLLTQQSEARGEYELGMVNATLGKLLQDGRLLQLYQQQTDAGIVNQRSFVTKLEGLNFLCLNTARCNSLTFAAKDVPETGHDALMGFFYDGKQWRISLYHANHRKDLDLSQIAVKYGGGGHRGACGFQTSIWPFFGQK